MEQVGALLFAAGFTGLAALCCGSLLLRRLGIVLARWEQLFLAFTAGSVCLSAAVFTLTALGLAYPALFGTLGVVAIAAAIWQRALIPAAAQKPAPIARSWQVLLVLVCGAYGVLYLGNALGPETSPDALVYHIPVIARYLREHRFVPIPTTMLADFPMPVEMLFLFGYAFGGPSAAAMIHVLFAFALGAGVLAYGRRIGSPAAGAVGSVLVFAAPIVGRDATAGYVDVAVACSVFAAYFALELWREEQRSAFLVVAGLLCGFSAAAKYTAGLVILFAIGFVALNTRKRMRPLAVLLLCAAIPVLPWLIKNAVFTRNPIAPVGNQFFANPYLYVFIEQALATKVSAHSVPLWRLPYELAVSGSRTVGSIGPVFLLAPLMLLALRQSAGRRLLAAAAFFSLVYTTTYEARFLIPVLPFVALGIGLALERWRAIAALAVIMQAMLCWPAALRLYNLPGAWRLDGLNWRAALRIQPEDQFLRAHVPDYAIGRLMDRVIPPGDLVYHVAGIQETYQSHTVIGSWQSALGVRLDEALRSAWKSDLQPTWLQDFRFPERAARAVRLIQEARSESDRWSISEIQVLRRGQRIPGPGWKATASPNPWDAALALDGNPTTRWTGGQAFRPGMFFQIDFPQDQTFDEVTVICAHDQRGVRVQIDGIHPAVSDIPPPPDLRAAATAYLRSNGVRWLVVHDLEPGGTDFRDRAAEWGIRPVAREQPYTIYQAK